MKGFPIATERTRPQNQARHWFAGALFDVIQYRQESPTARLAVALPWHPTYQALATRTTWLQRAAPFVYLWVTEAGEVVSEPDAP